MKKLIIISFIVFLFSGTSAADWEITVSGWTMSPGPNLAYEEVHKDGVIVSECGQILPSQNKACVFNLPVRANEEIKIVSFDENGNYAENIIGTIGLGPNPSSGGSVTVIWK